MAKSASPAGGSSEKAGLGLDEKRDGRVEHSKEVGKRFISAPCLFPTSDWLAREESLAKKKSRVHHVRIQDGGNISL